MRVAAASTAIAVTGCLGLLMLAGTWVPPAPSLYPIAQNIDGEAVPQVGAPAVAAAPTARPAMTAPVPTAQIRVAQSSRPRDLVAASSGTATATSLTDGGDGTAVTAEAPDLQVEIAVTLEEAAQEPAGLAQPAPVPPAAAQD